MRILIHVLCRVRFWPGVGVSMCKNYDPVVLLVSAATLVEAVQRVPGQVIKNHPKESRNRTKDDLG